MSMSEGNNIVHVNKVCLLFESLTALPEHKKEEN